MLSRRALVGRLAAGAAGAAVAWVAGEGRANAASARQEANTPPGAGPGEQLGPGADRLATVSDVASASAEALAPASAVIDASPPVTVSAPPPWELLRPLALGSVVAHGWRVADLTGVEDGSCVLTLQNARGRTHRVHLCRNDGRPQGLVYTERLDLVVMNGGQGDLPTEEGLAQAVAKVAHVLAANERNRQQGSEVAELLPHAERVRLFAAAASARLR